MANYIGDMKIPHGSASVPGGTGQIYMYKYYTTGERVISITPQSLFCR